MNVYAFTHIMPLHLGMKIKLLALKEDCHYVSFRNAMDNILT
jgi:hypothetical protein